MDMLLFLKTTDHDFGIACFHVTRINLKKTEINIVVPHHNGRIAVPETFGELTNVQAAHSGGDGVFEPGDGIAGGIGVFLDDEAANALQPVLNGQVSHR